MILPPSEDTLPTKIALGTVEKGTKGGSLTAIFSRIAQIDRQLRRKISSDHAGSRGISSSLLNRLRVYDVKNPKYPLLPATHESGKTHWELPVDVAHIMGDLDCQ